MADKNLTEIVVILDRSGSMSMVADDTIGGFNTLINNQKLEPGKANVTVALFDHEYTLLYDGVDINDIKSLDRETYVPRGSTALFDAVGRTMYAVRSRIQHTEESRRPSRVIVTIITDGQENASVEFKAKGISNLIKEQRSQDWEVIFVGADEKSLSDARSMGLGFARGAGGQSVSASYTMGSVDSHSMNMAYHAINSAITSYRSTGELSDWTNVLPDKNKED